MPEAPDLAVIRDYLEARLTGQEVVSARVLKPLVLRSLTTEEFASDIAGRRFEAFQRRGKLLLLHLSGDRLLAVYPMLAGALQHCPPQERVLKRVCLLLELSGGMHLRYLDEIQMGKLYYGSEGQVRAHLASAEQGPDVLDEPLKLEEFTRRLRPFRGEVKGILTRGAFVSGIGNAYADEILWAAELSPFRKRTELSADQVARLHEAVYGVPQRAVQVLQERMGEAIHVKVRDFLEVHGKGGQPCPRCGKPVSSITANQRLTNYCRHCQPGMLIKN